MYADSRNIGECVGEKYQFSFSPWTISFSSGVNIYFHFVDVLLHYLHLILMMRDVFLEYNKIYMVIL